MSIGQNRKGVGRFPAKVASYGENPDGSVCNNEDHGLFIVRDGKVAQAKQYPDTRHTFAVFPAGK